MIMVFLDSIKEGRNPPVAGALWASRWIVLFRVRWGALTPATLSLCAAHKDEKKVSEFHQCDVFPWRISPVSETGLSAGLSLDLSFMVSLPLQSSGLLSRAKPPHGNLVPQGPAFYFCCAEACLSGTKSLFLVWSQNQRDFEWHALILTMIRLQQIKHTLALEFEQWCWAILSMRWTQKMWGCNHKESTARSWWLAFLTVLRLTPKIRLYPQQNLQTDVR